MAAKHRLANAAEAALRLVVAAGGKPEAPTLNSLVLLYCGTGRPDRALWALDRLREARKWLTPEACSARGCPQQQSNSITSLRAFGSSDNGILTALCGVV